MKSVKKALVASIAFASTALVAGTASADYVCNVGYFAESGTVWGSDGALYVSVYSGKNCTGNFVKTYALCSAGATNVSCAVNRTNDRQTLLANLQALQHAAAVDQKITASTTTCIGGLAGCALYFKYWAE